MNSFSCSQPVSRSLKHKTLRWPSLRTARKRIRKITSCFLKIRKASTRKLTTTRTSNPRAKPKKRPMKREPKLRNAPKRRFTICVLNLRAPPKRRFKRASTQLFPSGSMNRRHSLARAPLHRLKSSPSIMLAVSKRSRLTLLWDEMADCITSVMEALISLISTKAAVNRHFTCAIF